MLCHSAIVLIVKLGSYSCRTLFILFDTFFAYLHQVISGEKWYLVTLEKAV